MIFNTKNSTSWFIWTGLMTALIIYLYVVISEGEDKSIFMPGPLTSGHHQIGLNCNACHKESYSDRESMQVSCIECHGDQRKKPFDFHPKAKFTDPRNADRLDNINALQCITCHTEHQPSITKESGVTQPMDFCIHCHEDIASERPSHEGMEFNSCANAGCHNYHDNRSLYTDYLIKHLDEKANLDKQVLPEKEFLNVIDEVMTYPHSLYPVKKLGVKDIDAPAYILTQTQKPDNTIHEDWLSTAHANSGVSCNGCHMPELDGKNTETWLEKPDHKACASCHNMEVKHFLNGKHGMRKKLNMSGMTPASARLAMKKESLSKELNCNTCHKAHRYDLKKAAVDVCLDCHDDKHSTSYVSSPHYKLWQLEINGQAEQGTGVSCASCHLPRVNYDVSDWLRRVLVQHNQNANLKPNEKMIRSVCANCHGLEFTLDSLADKNLIQNNFNKAPEVHIQTMDMAKKELLRRNKNRSDL